MTVTSTQVVPGFTGQGSASTITCSDSIIKSSTRLATGSTQVVSIVAAQGCWGIWACVECGICLWARGAGASIQIVSWDATQGCCGIGTGGECCVSFRARGALDSIILVVSWHAAEDADVGTSGNIITTGNTTFTSYVAKKVVAIFACNWGCIINAVPPTRIDISTWRTSDSTQVVSIFAFQGCWGIGTGVECGICLWARGAGASIQIVSWFAAQGCWGIGAGSSVRIWARRATGSTQVVSIVAAQGCIYIIACFPSSLPFCTTCAINCIRSHKESLFACNSIYIGTCKNCLSK